MKVNALAKRYANLRICVIYERKLKYMNNTKNPNAVRSKNMITDALLELMKIYPYNEITVKQIVLETDLVRKTFYRNFSSKDDVLNSYIATIVSEYINNINNTKEKVLKVIFDFCDKYKDFLCILSQNNMLYLLSQNLNKHIPLVYEKICGTENPFAKSFDGLEPKYLIAFNIGAICSVIEKWIEGGMTDSFDEIQNVLEKYCENIPFAQNVI